MTGGKVVQTKSKIDHHDLAHGHHPLKSDAGGAGEVRQGGQDGQDDSGTRTVDDLKINNDPGLDTFDSEGERTLRRNRARSKFENDKMKLEKGLEVKEEDPLGSVPEAVMREYLLKYLETTEDKRNLSWASHSAAELLGISKWNWRFHELYEIPNFQNLFSKKEILSFRLVSRDWRRAVDSIWEATNDIEPDSSYSSFTSILSSPSTLADYGRRAFQRKQLQLLPDLAGSTTTKIDKFLGETDLYPGNPFISRVATFLSFSDGNNENDRDYWRQVRVVLDKFGRDLRSMQIRSYSGFTTAQMLTTIKECLEGVPHLSTLHLTLFSLLVTTGGDGPDQFPVFPPLPNLTRLSISHGKWPIHQPLALYFDQLVSLEVRNSEMFMGWYDPQVHSTFPKLKHFAVCIDSEEELRKLQFLTSPLREVDIKSRLSNLCPSVYFYFLRRFRETLRACKIHQNYNCHSGIKTLAAYGLPEDEFAQAQAHLPRLKTLSLNITECAHLPVEQFLILAESLEYLELVVESRPCHVQSHEYWTNMDESNLWNVLPYLQEIHVRYDPILRRYKRPNNNDKKITQIIA